MYLSIISTNDSLQKNDRRRNSHCKLCAFNKCLNTVTDYVDHRHHFNRNILFFIFSIYIYIYISIYIHGGKMTKFEIATSVPLINV
jgi:hypothetical protein